MRERRRAVAWPIGSADCETAHADGSTQRYQVTPLATAPQANTYDAIILAVAHPEFLQWGAAGIHALGKSGHVLYDVKSLLPKGEADGRL